LESYIDEVRKQSVRDLTTRPEDVERAFAHMVIDRPILRQLGTALNSGTSIFLYGPTGVGKSTMAETLSRVLAEGGCWIPYAVEIGGQIITVHDPLLHKDSEEEEFEHHDKRWVRCHRPTVLVGGELTVEMLDLQFNPITKFYVAPAQMKANNGVLIIDDFGRQRIRPDELLNRWVVPLDRRIDFLTLSGGRKIEVPFDMLVVFATNMNPAELVDAAFLRRIQTKIRVGAVSEDQFCEIFRRVAVGQGLEADDQIVRELIVEIRRSSNSELKPCYPRDLVNQICWSARYEGRQPELDRESLRDAVASYFLPDA
jgi:SpoVK/Ycf46/Vps4 family AAA+-type ATPase